MESNSDYIPEQVVDIVGYMPNVVDVMEFRLSSGSIKSTFDNFNVLSTWLDCYMNKFSFDCMDEYSSPVTSSVGNSDDGESVNNEYRGVNSKTRWNLSLCTRLHTILSTHLLSSDQPVPAKYSIYTCHWSKRNYLTLPKISYIQHIFNWLMSNMLIKSTSISGDSGDDNDNNNSANLVKRHLCKYFPSDTNYQQCKKCHWWTPESSLYSSEPNVLCVACATPLHVPSS